MCSTKWPCRDVFFQGNKSCFFFLQASQKSQILREFLAPAKKEGRLERYMHACCSHVRNKRVFSSSDVFRLISSIFSSHPCGNDFRGNKGGRAGIIWLWQLSRSSFVCLIFFRGLAPLFVPTVSLQPHHLPLLLIFLLLRRKICLKTGNISGREEEEEEQFEPLFIIKDLGILRQSFGNHSYSWYSMIRLEHSFLGCRIIVVDAVCMYVEPLLQLKW